MATCGTHHKELTNGVGKCSRPMWWGNGLPAGFCDEPAYGPADHKKTDLYVPFLACPRHGGPNKPQQDET